MSYELWLRCVCCDFASLDAVCVSTTLRWSLAQKYMEKSGFRLQVSDNLLTLQHEHKSKALARV